MRSILFGFLLFCIWAAFARYYYVCKIKGLCYEKVEEAPKHPKTLHLKLEDKVILRGYEQFYFPDGKIQPDITDNNKQFLNQVADHLKKHPNQNLNLIGYYRKNESGMKSGYHSNLGQARADHIRSLLLKRGISEDRITMEHRMAAGNTLTNSILYELFYTEKNGQPTAYDFTRLKYTFEDMTYHFDFDSDEFKPDEALEYYTDSLGVYLLDNTAVMMTITGHTDHIDTHEYNDALGLKRANAAKAYFQEEGIDPERIKVESMGKRSPVAPNDTKENMRKNRRVNFKLE